MSCNWPKIPLGKVLKKSEEWINLEPDKRYKEVTVRLWGKGVSLRREVNGVEIASQRRLVVRENQFILSRIDARNGAFGLIPESLNGAIVSNDFPVFNLDEAQIVPLFLNWMSKTNAFIDLCVAASEGTTNRVRLQEERFLATPISLPPLPEQQRIVARIESLDAKIKEIKKLKGEIGEDENKLLLGSFYKLISGVNLEPMKKIAPITRRPVNIDDTSGYPEIGIRSFGNGTFHKPNINGIDIGSKKLYQVQIGDLLFSNVFAWEGAIAVVQPEDTGRFGSHRFISCVPKEEVITANFLRFYFLTVEGLEKIGLASPGGAGRNRTLGLDKLEAIDVPVPSYKKQLWFDKLQSKVQEIRKVQSITTVELDALLPSILDKAFKGEL
ncbi:MAG: hypothetical protein NPIRA03_30280 [Nitrospirales bacterium]|nr:MAG: hypothetical protein NPIRA03_30280 [Nitrospirales bacterium]